ncbi:MAG: ATP-binding cassette domain-containing protein [Myxococcales bacterium]|nr:ATP-binding cassette domain-containing protein [Myxococcales bacterium]
MPPAIVATDLTRRYGPTLALDGVSFEVARGEVVGLLGPNGAGKTTCMRMLTGFLPPTRGRAQLGDGEDLVDASSGKAARRLLGYLPENAPLYGEMRVQRYLAFRARLRGIAWRERGKAIDRVLEACRLGDVRSSIIGRLSKGYRQRVGLADALLAEPPVLVLDEPGAGLDPNQMRELRQLIADIGRERTVLLSSHLLSEVQAVCQRVLIVMKGKLVASGDVASLRARGGARVVARVEGDVEAVRAALEPVELGDAQDGAEIEVERDDEAQLTHVSLSGGDDEERARELSARLSKALAPLGLVEVTVERAPLERVFAELTEGGAGGEGER